MSIKGTHFVGRLARHGNRTDAMAPQGVARARPGAAWRAVMAITTTCLLAAAPAAASAAETVQNVGGFAIYLGVLPSAMVQGHSSAQPEQKMHGGPPAGRNQRHVVIAVFDARSGARIEDAIVTAKVGEPGLAQVEKRLDPMPIAGAMSYGNYFAMAPPGPYRIDVRVEQPDTGRSARVSFTYSVPR